MLGGARVQGQPVRLSVRGIAISSRASQPVALPDCAPSANAMRNLLAAAPLDWPAAVESGDQLAIPSVLMRGGTSRGAFLRAEDLPRDPGLRDRVILAIYGSPDARQIDGIGGATSLTSKVALVSRSSRKDADVDYLFGQVRVDEPLVDYSGNCGNMLAAVGPFAVDEGLVPACEPRTRVRIHNVNTGQIVLADVPTVAGKAQTAGATTIAGVPGTGASIMLDFANAGGTLGRGLLPTGLPCEEIGVPDGRSYTVSIVDAGNPVVFVAANDLSLKVDALLGDSFDCDLLETLEAIRGVAAVRLGLVEKAARAAGESPAIPKVYLVHEPVDFVDRFGRLVPGSELTLVARGLSMGRPHAAYAITVAVCTATAACIPGTVVAVRARRNSGEHDVRIGHPSGITPVEVEVDATLREDPELVRARVERTARRLMAGVSYVPAAVLQGER
jgi:2-methylaconitate cis-trans-isomerase PrpF